MNVKDKKVLVVGLGISGFAAAKLLLKQGARVVACDDSNVLPLLERAQLLESMGAQVQLSVPYRNIRGFDFAVVSPGVPPTVPIMKDVATAEIPVLSELELGSRFCRCPIIAITGTNGKTTTTELVTAVLQSGGKRAVAAGNIGVAFCEAVAQSDVLDAMVLEVSSFQLETIEKFRPQVSVMLNITPDHLDRHRSMHEYILAKSKIYQNQADSDFAIINAATLPQIESVEVAIKARCTTFSTANSKADLWFKDGLIHGRRGYLRGKLLALSETALRGAHNAENVMAALAAGSVFAVSREAMTNAIRAYKVQPHRMEFVAEIGGVTYVNDSKATNVDAVEKALQTFTSPVVLIAGGKDKGYDFQSLKPLLKEKVRRAVLIGETRKELAKTWSDTIPCCEAKTLREAVLQAAAASRPGDIVLLGPACSSFDMFKNYEDRGDTFKRLVNELSISSEAKGKRGSDASGENVENAPLQFGATS